MMNSLRYLTIALLLMLAIPASASIYSDAVDHPSRSEKDREVDDRRKPAEILEFFEIEQGMKEFDVFAGSGYYSEILSYLVGENGSIAAYNNTPWDNYVDKSLTQRLAGERLPNVKRMVATPESLADMDADYDAAIFILGMHDIYYADDENNWPSIDKEKFLNGIFKLLKEGAVFGVIDANAQQGADNSKVGKELHRVDPQAIIEDVTAAGFELEQQSDLLRNPKDDKISSVFTPENRYNTDRSVLKFRKPKTK